MGAVEERKCPSCGDPLVINAVHEYQIGFDDGKWTKDVGTVEYSCNNCKAPLHPTEIQDILEAVDEL